MVDVTRMARALSRHPRLMDRIFSPAERQSVGPGGNPERLAARFAAKEALIKAAGGLQGGRWQDIEVVRRPGQAPAIRVTGPLGNWIAAKGVSIWLSFSHERGAAVAVVVLERRDG